MIYAIQNQTNGLIKIGYTAGLVRDRLSQLQTACADRLTILCEMPGEMWQEKELHSRLARHRLGGEWFRPHLEVMQAIELLSKQRSELDPQPFAAPDLCHLVTLLIDHEVQIDIDHDGTYQVFGVCPSHDKTWSPFFRWNQEGDRGKWHETPAEACANYIRNFEEWKRLDKPC